MIARTSDILRDRKSQYRQSKSSPCQSSPHLTMTGAAARWRARRLTQTLNFTFLYVTVSTLKPTVGMVVTDWLSLSL